MERFPANRAVALDQNLKSDYSDHIKLTLGETPVQNAKASLEMKVVPIGNSRGVRLPKAVLEKYAIGDVVVAEHRAEGLLLRGNKDKRLSWDATYQDMARHREDWRDLDSAIADGLDALDAP